jgi:hypothetical protein
VVRLTPECPAICERPAEHTAAVFHLLRRYGRFDVSAGLTPGCGAARGDRAGRPNCARISAMFAAILAPMPARAPLATAALVVLFMAAIVSLVSEAFKHHFGSVLRLLGSSGVAA